ncbi:hypothetical protein TNCV_475921 [Trichonephila clavipes]|nr:hypothetical protein TNCV_475921 [Trichonephila clavipes]
MVQEAWTPGNKFTASNPPPGICNMEVITHCDRKMTQCATVHDNPLMTTYDKDDEPVVVGCTLVYSYRVAVDSLVVRASDSRQEDLGAMPYGTKYPPSTLGIGAREISGSESIVG